MLPNSTPSLRDLAIKQITEGTNRYNTSNNFEEKKKGYDLFILGVQNMMKSGKNESNPEIVKVIKEKLVSYLSQGEEMKRSLASLFPSTPAEDYSKPKNGGHLQPPKSPRQEGSKIKDGGDEEKFKNNLTEAIVTEKPNVKWDDVAGLHNAKKALQEAVILPIRFPQIFVGSRQPWKGILLYGPPGTGKTYLAKACATECDATFFSLSSSDLISKWVGESEKLIKTLFKMAREQKPSIIFIDEVDSLASNRSEGENDSTRRVKTELLVQMQGVGKEDTGVLVLGATNIPWELDPAVRRRFEKRIYIPLPDAEARAVLLKNQLKNTPNNLELEDFEYLANITEGFSGSDLSVLIRDASFQPLRKCERATKFKKVMVDGKVKYEPCAPSEPTGSNMNFMDLSGDVLKLPEVDIDDFTIALSKCKPSVSLEDVKKQVEFTEKFGQEG